MKRWFAIVFLITLVIAVSMTCLRQDTEDGKHHFADWRKNYNLTPEIIESDAHNAYVEIYLNEKAKDDYINVATHFKKGSVVFRLRQRKW